MVYDVTIVGGGIVGLGTAHRLLQAQPRFKVLLLEKEGRLAAHQTGNNSGVLHSGLYYKPGSEKARLSVGGLKQMVAFCREHGGAHEICGKIVVATEENELPRLDNLWERGNANGIALSLAAPATVVKVGNDWQLSDTTIVLPLGASVVPEVKVR